eukprot:CAMPEP_0118952556 /NCGR_PEP_ID=MMETSP1169-20130426/55070_1 /TAXON_ID=36882 /ORGANISM="Pyramimonas obovata, Strain CCMP722" /LENGTH=40 /DNA_ID= /DNA_START= /DNA_END= /DNA_ORIENTATION=
MRDPALPSELIRIAVQAELVAARLADSDLVLSVQVAWVEV